MDARKSGSVVFRSVAVSSSERPFKVAAFESIRSNSAFEGSLVAAKMDSKFSILSLSKALSFNMEDDDIATWQ